MSESPLGSSKVGTENQSLDLAERPIPAALLDDRSNCLTDVVQEGKGKEKLEMMRADNASSLMPMRGENWTGG